MGKINVLKENIAAKIAAGEVIERPVSVVKELVENSIDAGSKNIIIEIKKGGKKAIRVIDDGEGISREDLKLAFERHATSKISKLDDIFNINTLGFRGEALASIASVSDVSVTSKTRNEIIGTLCKINGGVIEEFVDTSSNDGSIIEVRNLFFNTPARLKFLNNDTQEASRITDLITRFAIGNINISFRLINEGREIFYTSGNGDYKEAIAKVYGVDLAKQVIYIEKDFDSGRIWGYISKPGFNRGNRTGQTFFVNNRFIKDRGLAFSLERAYKSLIPLNRFPIAIIFIEINNSLIDVNVHPSKTEIKFQRENQVHRMLFDAINDSLKKQVLIPKEPFNIAPVKTTFKNTGSQIKLDGEILPKNEYYYNNDNKIYNNTVAKAQILKEPTIIEKDKNTIYTKDNSTNTIKSQEITESTKKLHKVKDVLPKYHFEKVIGQLFNTYIVVQGKKEFYLIDQHAAHERILYETYFSKYSKPADSQKLIAPYVLHLSAQDMMSIENFKEDVIKMGFDFSVFGSDSILVRSVPYLFNKPVDPIVIRDALDQLQSREYAGYPPKERFIISMSCHTAIKAGDVLSFLEIQELLRKLQDTEGPYTCPHGRPTIIAMTLSELEKKFKRK
ncbi:MAG: DNA mismatch repair endonuclease MutL [Tepidanaerobacteraceae bacterium]|nr:DNA mismatch repair endonuclease MutL [Tepidanaerobacteraceae bacterium]